MSEYSGVLTISINEAQLSEIASKLQQFSIKERGQRLLSAFKEASLLLERNLKSNVSNRLLMVRSGRLRSSIGSLVEKKGGSFQATIGSGVRQGERVVYADILETGGTIYPKNKRFLTIPLDAAKTSAGVPRFTAGQVRDGQTKYIASFIDKGIIFGVLKRGKKNIKSYIEPLFALKTSVTIPAKYWMSKTVEENSKAIVDQILFEVDRVWEEAPEREAL